MWLDYIILVKLTALGFLQLAAFQSKIRALQITSHDQLHLVLCLCLLILPSIWFFASENRNLADTNGGLDGGDQAWLFVVGCFLALILNLAISHKNGSSKRPTRRKLQGLDALINESCRTAVWHNMKILRSKWKT